MWSGPRNISTALMRSFENRNDIMVIDEPFYAYYLKFSENKHPLYRKIINNYETNEIKIINKILKQNNKNKFIKHMTHHINLNTNLNWIKNTKNFFLIRHPEKVINSYIKKNKLNNINDLGFIEQVKIFEYVKKFSKQKPIVINSSSLLKNPKNILSKLCNKLDLKFEPSMLKWPKGERNSDGIWSTVWYKSVINSSKFNKEKVNKINIPKKYHNILNECLDLYSKLNRYSIKL